MESRLAEIPGAVPKPKKGKKGGDEPAPKGFEVRICVGAWRLFCDLQREVEVP